MFPECDLHQIIADIAARGKLPIIVGGSNYYIQSLVTHNLIDDWLEDDPEEPMAAPEGDTMPCVTLL
jgi:tRNA dimethylallyltransferase